MPRQIIDLWNWSTCYRGDAFTPPEHRVMCLQGTAFNHPDHDDGSTVITSGIRNVTGVLTTTHSGSIYRLCEPSRHFTEYLRREGFNPDPLDTLQQKFSKEPCALT